MSGRCFSRCGASHCGSALAATSNTYKADAAVYGAHTLLASLRDAGILPDTLDSIAPSVQGPAATRMAKDVKQQLLASTLLQQLPALLTNAALQLQAAAGVTAATETQQASMADPACSTSQPASNAENQAVNVISLMFMIHNLTPIFSDSSDVGASCLPPAQHLVLAIRQFFTTLPALQPSQQDSQADSCSGQHSTLLTAAQLQLSSLAWELFTMSSNAVAAAVESQRHISAVSALTHSPAASNRPGHVAPASREAGSPQGLSTPQARIADAAVRTRHHMEALCLGIVQLQLGLLIKHKQKQEQQQHRASTPAAGLSAEQLRYDSLPQVPAPIQWMLLQLGCNPHASRWQALRSVHDAPGTSQSDRSIGQIEDALVQAADRCIGMRDLTKRFLLDSTPTDLPQSLLLELQQHLQLHKLLPGVLLHWVAGKPSSDSNYSKCCYHATNAAMISGNMYFRVLQDGPDILYQHMTGHSRSQPKLSERVDVPADSQLTAVVPIPADVLKSQLQLLEQLLNNMLQLWRNKYSEDVQSSSARSSSDSLPESSSSSASNQRAAPCKVDNNLLRAIFSAGSLALHQVVMAELPPGHHPTSTTTDSVKAKTLYSRAASNDAGRLCALLENVSRMELTADLQAAAAAMMAATRGSVADNSTQRWVPGTLPPVHATVYVRFSKLDSCQAGPLLDPILAHYCPGTKPCMQLCSLLATMLKCSAWDSSCPEASLASDAAADATDEPGPAVLAEATRAAVCGAACAVVEAATAQVTACQFPASEIPGGGSTCNCSSDAASKGAEAVLPWLVVLGRCCLQWGHFIQAEVASREAAGMSAAAFRLFSAFMLADLSSGDLAEAAGITLQSGQRASVVQNFEAVVAISKSWLSAGSHTAQLAALGYDAEGLMQSLHSAEATATVAVRDGLPAGAQPEDVLRQLQKQLQVVGMALTSFAHPSACNNPLCSNPAGPSEAVLVRSKTSRCSICRAARYCGKACQVSHWKQHKHVCKRLAAAAAAVAAAGPGVDKG